MANLQATTFSQDGYLTLPVGDVAGRPTAGTGMLRYNNNSANSTNLLEFYDGTNWRPVTGYSAGTLGTGGDSIFYINNSIVHMFTTVGNSTFTPAFTGNVQVLVVAGGGGSGYDWCGGGGGGGMLQSRAFPVTSGTGITVTVGRGGTSSTSSHVVGQPGANSVFSTITATGGGGGGSWQTGNNACVLGQPGGSGGGGSNTGDTSADSRVRCREGDGISGQGYPGGAGVRFNTSSDNAHMSGGGGGAGGRGGAAPDERNNQNDNWNYGGPGAASDILGSTLYWGGGGAGGAHHQSNVAAGGIGGGGGGCVYHNGPYRPGSAMQGKGGGQALNTGGSGSGHHHGGSGGTNTGGGAGGGQHGNGPSGGSGIVIVRY